MVFNAVQDYVAIADLPTIPRPGRVSVKRLGGIFASSATCAVGKLVTDPFLRFALLSHYQTRLLIEEPVTDEAGKLATSATGSEPTPADEATHGVGSSGTAGAGISLTSMPNSGSTF
jgi:hypothetical protein